MSFRIKLITTWTLWSHYHYVQVLLSQFSQALCDPCSPPGSSVQGLSPGKNIGVSCHALLQGIFPTQESNPGLPSCRQILYRLSHQGSPYVINAAAAAAKWLQSCPTLCDPIDGSPPGSLVPGILQARTLKWVAISFSSVWNMGKWSRSVVSDSSVAHGLQPTRLLRLWGFPGKSTGVGCHCLLSCVINRGS